MIIDEFVMVVKNVIENDVCNEILKEYSNNDEWIQAKISSGNSDNFVRNCKIISSSNENSIKINFENRKEIDNKIFNSFNNVIKKYKEKFPLVNISKDSGFDILKYEIGGFYRKHIDSFSDSPRSLTCSILINDDFDGGDFVMFDENIKYDLKKGDALIFPSNFMYPHEITEITKGTRYSIITWFV